MQILQGEQYRKQSQNISQRAKKIPAQRGEIFDRNGSVPMVLNIDSFAVDVTPGEIAKDEFSTVISKLARYLDLPASHIEKKIPQNIRRSFQSIEIKSNVTYATIAGIAERIDECRACPGDRSQSAIMSRRVRSLMSSAMSAILPARNSSFSTTRAIR
jgi:penicillin-binding protein 2